MNKVDYFSGIFLVSLATLLLELSLTRVMSVALWYHFGFLVISTALLGFGSAGVVLAVWANLREKYDLNKTLFTLSLLFGVVTLASYALLQKIPFNPFSVATDKRQLYIMPLYYITIAAPFFISGLMLSLLFTRVTKSMSLLYAFDLIGAALGCLCIVWAMPALGGSGSVFLSAALGMSAAFFFTTTFYLRILTLLLFALLFSASFAANSLVPIKITDNKRDAATSRVPIYTKWNTFSFIELYEAKPDTNGFRGARRFLIDGGTAATGITNLSKGVSNYLSEHRADSLYSSVPAYLGRKNLTVLNIGSGAGDETLDALHMQARKVVSVDINPIINNAIKYDMNDYWGGLFNLPNSELVTEDGRSFINRSDTKFDLILSSHTISNAAVASGSISLSENYILTLEAFRAYYDHLSDAGVLYFTRPESQLPRLFTTARVVLEEHGVADFTKHFVAYRFPPSKEQGVKSFTSIFIMKKSAFTAEELAGMQASLGHMGIRVDGHYRRPELLYLPQQDEVDNVYDTIVTTKNIEAFYKSAAGQVAPATDDKPFFNQHIRWSQIGVKSFVDVFSQNNPMAARMALENKPVAEVTLLIILLQSVLLAGLLILFPLFRYNRRGLEFHNKWRYLGYFAMLGLGFIMIEIAFIQRFTLYLGQPVYTLAVIIAGLLLFTGVGSFLTEKLAIDSHSLKRKYFPLLLGILILTSLLTPVLFNATIDWQLPWRIALTLVLLAPLGMLLGMPFPTGIKSVSQRTSMFIPWAWGVNGFFTVIGSVCAIILGMMLGFKMVILLAGCCYVVAMAVLPAKADE